LRPSRKPEYEESSVHDLLLSSESSKGVDLKKNGSA
jgi:hypothetical protein